MLLEFLSGDGNTDTLVGVMVKDTYPGFAPGPFSTV